ncbi:MAG TPA: hypothetical protein VL576_00820 [Candidatus Paceibacterota bacterium]|jgi:hypothetical protein|nr:hypothetical protein [Candidatus Paceibacterota bacterium]
MTAPKLDNTQFEELVCMFTSAKNINAVPPSVVDLFRDLLERKDFFLRPIRLSVPIKDAKDFEEAQNIYCKTPRHSDQEQVALRQVIDLAQSAQEIGDFFSTFEIIDLDKITYINSAKEISIYGVQRAAELLQKN